MLGFEGVITSACSQKSTQRTLGLLRGHLTPCRAFLVATASSVVAYYEYSKDAVSCSKPTQAAKTLLQEQHNTQDITEAIQVNACLLLSFSMSLHYYE